MSNHDCPLSAVVLTKNRAQMLKKCLESLAWCDEVIVLDDNSTDDTQKIVKEFKNTRCFVHSLNGDFAAQHNFGLKQCTHDWVLFVDDDEWVNTKLAQEIMQTIPSNKASGYFLSRKDYFFGHFLSHGETASVKLLRLGQKNEGSWQRKVHEFWQISGTISSLVNPLFHFPHPTISQFIASINGYTTIDALELQKEGKSFSVVRLVLNPMGKFFQNYFLRLGFLDGQAGFIMAFMMSLHSLIVRVKQYDLSKSS